MNRAGIPNIGVLFACTVLGSAVAAGFVWALQFIVQPSDLDQRMARIAQRADRVQSLQQGHKSPNAYPPGAVCASTADTSSVEQQFRGLAAGLNLAVSEFKTDAQKLVKDDPLVTVRFQMVGSGEYRSIMGVMANMSDILPLVFIDSLDVETQADLIQLNLKGRFYCWPSA